MCGRPITTSGARKCDYHLATENADDDDRIEIARVMYGDETAPLLPPIEDTDEQIAIIDDYDSDPAPSQGSHERIQNARQDENVWRPR